jgi:hypothetical protein
MPLSISQTEAERRYDSERAGTAYIKPAPAITIRDHVLGLLAELKTMPTGAQICDLLAEDQIANFVWWRCVDWVLYRLAHGLPVQRMNTDDDVPAAINAQFEEAKTRMYRARTTGERMSDIFPRKWDLSNATTIERWERTPPPAPAAAIRVTYDHTNPNDDGDLNSDGIGDLAYTNFVCGEGDAKAEISFSHLPLDDAGRAVVYLFGRDDVDLDQVERTLESLLVLLADPRVQALRSAQNAA